MRAFVRSCKSRSKATFDLNEVALDTLRLVGVEAAAVGHVDVQTARSRCVSMATVFSCSSC